MVNNVASQNYLLNERGELNENAQYIITSTAVIVGTVALMVLMTLVCLFPPSTSAVIPLVISFGGSLVAAGQAALVAYAIIKSSETAPYSFMLDEASRLNFIQRVKAFVSNPNNNEKDFNNMVNSFWDEWRNYRVSPPPYVVR